MNIIEALRILGACAEARHWVNNRSTWEEVVRDCRNPSWLIWLIDTTKALDEREVHSLAMHLIERTPSSDGKNVLDCITNKGALKAIRTSIAFRDGAVDIEELRSAHKSAIQIRCTEGGTTWEQKRLAVKACSVAHMVLKLDHVSNSLTALLSRHAVKNIDPALSFQEWNQTYEKQWNNSKEFQAEEVRRLFGNRIAIQLNKLMPLN